MGRGQGITDKGYGTGGTVGEIPGIEYEARYVVRGTGDMGWRLQDTRKKGIRSGEQKS